MTNVVIASAARTPVGSFLGSFANTPAHELGRVVIEAVVERAGVDKPYTVILTTLSNFDALWFESDYLT